MAQDNLFFDDIRNEMTDHIASHIEATLPGGGSFDEVLTAYMHSHNKVKLLTAARQQEALRNKSYHAWFLRQFVSLKGISAALVLFAVLHFGYSLTPWILYSTQVLFMVVMLLLLFRLLPKQTAALRACRKYFSIVQLYYLLPILFITQIHRWYGDSAVVLLIRNIVLALCLAGLYFIATSHKDFNRKKYA